METFNEWLVFSLLLFGIWIVVFVFNKKVRREMFIVSLFTMPFGLTEPIFVPRYWSPPSLFNLAANTGFDIESLIFSFAIGGIGSVLYETIFKSGHEKIHIKKSLRSVRDFCILKTFQVLTAQKCSAFLLAQDAVKHLDMKKMNHIRHRFHLLSLFSPIIVFLPLFFFTKLNPIYSASIAMFVGGISAMFCRPDLKKKIILGGILFLVLYFLFFISFTSIYPYAIENFWNISALSGILILKVPLEELMFAFTFGVMWSSVYEHIKWYKLIKE